MRVIYLIIIALCFFSCNDEATINQNNSKSFKESPTLDSTVKSEDLKLEKIVRDTFMDYFLQGIVDKNRHILKSYISFPILVRGSLDSDLRKKVYEEEFYSKFLIAFLGEKNVCGANVMNNKDRFISKSCIRKVKSGSENFKIDKFRFKKNGDKWILATVYSEFYNDPKNLE